MNGFHFWFGIGIQHFISKTTVRRQAGSFTPRLSFTSYCWKRLLVTWRLLWWCANIMQLVVSHSWTSQYRGCQESLTTNVFVCKRICSQNTQLSWFRNDWQAVQKSYHAVLLQQTLTSGWGPELRRQRSPPHNDTAAETELVPLHNKASLFTHLLYVLWFLFWP